MLQPNLSYKVIFLFAYNCNWDLGLTRSDPGLFPQDSTHPHKKLGLYDNENVRVLVFDIDWVFVLKLPDNELCCLWVPTRNKAREVLLGILGGGGGMRTQFSKSWRYFRPKKCHFSHRFHTWLLKSIPVFKPSLRNYHDQYIRFIYREKTVYSTTHETIINRHVKHTGEMKHTFYVR